MRVHQPWCINPNPEHRGGCKKYVVGQELTSQRRHHIQKRAAAKGLAYDLDQDFLLRLYSSPCHYCGVQGDIQIDRMDNSLGYLKNNCVPACRRCNTVKSSYITADELRRIVEMLGWNGSKLL